VPPIPKELILILSARSGGNGVATTGTVKLYSEKGTEVSVRFYRCPMLVTNLLFGLGALSFIFGGMVLCSNAKIDLMRLLIPEAPSECPRLGFTEPIYTPLAPNTLPIAVVSIGSPLAVPVP
jgi:hypothetical protein